MINHLQLRLLISILFIYLKGRNCRDINGTRFNSQLGRVFITNHSTTISSSTKFSFPPLHNDNTTTKPPQLNTTFTWPPINNNNSTTTKTPQHQSTFTWPLLHTTPDPFVWTQDFVTIIVGVSLGGVIFIAIVGYVIIRNFNKNPKDEVNWNIVQ